MFPWRNKDRTVGRNVETAAQWSAESLIQVNPPGAKYSTRRWSNKSLPELPINDVSTYDRVSTKATDTFYLPSRRTAFNDTAQRIHHGLFSEKEMTVLNCCRKYPNAIFWSLMLSLTVVMEAYDKSLIASFLAFPAFKRAYGQGIETLKASPHGVEREIMIKWQIWLLNIPVITEIFGLLAHGYITYIIGYQKVMIGSLVWLCLAIFPAFFATNIYVLMVWQALAGKNSPFKSLKHLPDRLMRNLRNPVGGPPDAGCYVRG
ncbi:hypothetical protein QQS21_000385 [Conoideocrella luteorostrata]|uniref:Uncharacterized protein n=1 Tax=Conoideocrella luteorostrata TaxID=1105319 RepID=A0AAJ0CZE9_9HYPO|nr:hypothetical protein QQS21_000385 [Conoideocrella luteorostrata]